MAMSWFGSRILSWNRLVPDGNRASMRKADELTSHKRVWAVLFHVVPFLVGASWSIHIARVFLYAHYR